jgi:hypothetical protein
MKRLLLVVFLVSAGVTAAYGQSPVIIDHNCIRYSQIPSQWITKAKSDLKVTYQHTSHGSQLVSGIHAIQATGDPLFSFTESSSGANASVFLNDYGMPSAADLGHAGDLAWRDATRQTLSAAGCNRNVAMWSWCGGVSDNDTAGIMTYLNAMSQLELEFPNVRFVYMTGHLDGGGSAGNLNLMNELIRSYCKTNGKILFDFGDIESFDPDGLVNYMEKFATDGCLYDSDGDGNPWDDQNWAANWVAANPGDQLTKAALKCGGCAHSEALNCVLKGGGFWWMMARLAGWDGITTDVESVPSAAGSGLIFSPNPAAGAVRTTIRPESTGSATWQLHDVLGRCVCQGTVQAQPGMASDLIVPMQGLPSGRYVCTVMSAGWIRHGTIVRVCP